jgi:hypothetical protein
METKEPVNLYSQEIPAEGKVDIEEQIVEGTLYDTDSYSYATKVEHLTTYETNSSDEKSILVTSYDTESPPTSCTIYDIKEEDVKDASVVVRNSPSLKYLQQNRSGSFIEPHWIPVETKSTEYRCDPRRSCFLNDKTNVLFLDHSKDGVYYQLKGTYESILPVEIMGGRWYFEVQIKNISKYCSDLEKIPAYSVGWMFQYERKENKYVLKM